jgi:hypothetical protein
MPGITYQGHLPYRIYEVYLLPNEIRCHVRYEIVASPHTEASDLEKRGPSNIGVWKVDGPASGRIAEVGRKEFDVAAARLFAGEVCPCRPGGASQVPRPPPLRVGSSGTGRTARLPPQWVESRPSGVKDSCRAAH